MSERPIDREAIRQAVQNLEEPAAEASEISEALVLAVRGIAMPHERKGLLFLALELEDRIERIGQCFDKAWVAVGNQGSAR